MALSYRSSSKNDSNTGTALSVAAPSGATTGDKVVVIVHANGQTTIVDNNGSTPFTENVNDYQPNTSNGHTVSVFSRTIQSGDPSTYNFTSGASGRWAVVAVCLQKGAGETIEFDVSPNTANFANADNSSTGDHTNPSITTGVANTIHITFCGWDTSATGTITTPSGYTLAQNTNSGGEPLHVSYKAIVSAGATGTTFITNTEFGARIGGSFSLKVTTSATDYTKNLSDNLNGSSTVIRSSTKVISLTVNHTSSVVRAASKTISLTVNKTSSVLKSTSKTLTGNLNKSSVLIRMGGKLFSLNLNKSSVLTKVLTSFRTLTDNVTRSSVLLKSLSKTFTNTLNAASSILLALTFSKVLTDTINKSSSIVRSVGKVVTSTINKTSSLLKSISKFLTESINKAEDFVKSVTSFYTLDATSNNNDLSVNGTAVEYTSSLPFGQSHAAADFDGSSYLSITDAAQTGLDITGNITIEAWVYLDALGNFAIVAKDDVPGNNRSYVFSVYDGFTGTYVLVFFAAQTGDGSTNTIAYSNSALTIGDVGSWIHLAVTYNTSTQTAVFYKNASAMGTTYSSQNATSIYNGTAPVRIGEGLNGKLDDIRIWNLVRNSTDISNNRSIELTGAESGLQAYWAFEAQLGTVLLVLSDTLGHTVSLIKTTTKLLSNNLNKAVVLLRSLSRTLTENINKESVFTFIKGIFFIEYINKTSSISFYKEFVRVFTESRIATSTISKSLSRTFSSAVNRASSLSLYSVVSRTLSIIYDILAYIFGLRKNPVLLEVRTQDPVLVAPYSIQPVILNCGVASPQITDTTGMSPQLVFISDLQPVIIEAKDN